MIIYCIFNLLQTILLGDSGVGKTSLLVQFDTGNFQPGNFAATVGIGFTVCNVKFNTNTRTHVYRVVCLLRVRTS